MSATAVRHVCKGCEGRCEIVIDELETTLAGWQQHFDKFGNDISAPNPNRVRAFYKCHECGKMWDVTEKNNVVLSCKYVSD